MSRVNKQLTHLQFKKDLLGLLTLAIDVIIRKKRKQQSSSAHLLQCYISSKLKKNGVFLGEKNSLLCHNSPALCTQLLFQKMLILAFQANRATSLLNTLLQNFILFLSLLHWQGLNSKGQTRATGYIILFLNQINVE